MYTLLCTLLSLLAEGGALDEGDLTSGLLGELILAAGAGDVGGGVGVDSADGEALGALDVHEVGVGALDEAHLLVLGALSLDGGVGEVGVEETHD